MSVNQGGKGIFKNERWLIIPGVILAVILAVVVRSQRATPKPGLPQTEPSISVYMSDTGQVKKMPLETYLEGVVAAEMEPSWPEQALEAQAIVARTFTLRKISDGGVAKRGTDASTDPKEFQAYNASRVNDKVKAAVAATRGQIITYGGSPINAWFHASSGGVTASAQEGLGYKKEATPYVISVTDIKAEPAHPWYQTFSNAAVSEAAAAVGVNVGHVTSIHIGRKGPSGRAETLKINGRDVPAPSFRLALGDKTMQSTLLDDVRMSGDSIYMKGRGFGHGVGMSQWGAWMMAQQGKSAADIVGYYFRGIKIQNLYQ
ncbi:MAG: SpoIID/LytB domain-containing protein [Bacillota bacterium]